MALLILHAKQPHIMPAQTRPGIGPVSRKGTGLSGEVWVTAAAGQQRRPVAGDEGAPGSAWWDCYTPGPARLLSPSRSSISFWQDTFVSPSQPAPSGKHYGFQGRPGLGDAETWARVPAQPLLAVCSQASYLTSLVFTLLKKLGIKKKKTYFTGLFTPRENIF